MAYTVTLHKKDDQLFAEVVDGKDVAQNRRCYTVRLLKDNDTVDIQPAPESFIPFPQSKITEPFTWLEDDSEYESVSFSESSSEDKIDLKSPIPIEAITAAVKAARKNIDNVVSVRTGMDSESSNESEVIIIQNPVDLEKQKKNSFDQADRDLKSAEIKLTNARNEEGTLRNAYNDRISEFEAAHEELKTMQQRFAEHRETFDRRVGYLELRNQKLENAIEERNQKLEELEERYQILQQKLIQQDNLGVEVEGIPQALNDLKVKMTELEEKQQEAVDELNELNVSQIELTVNTQLNLNGMLVNIDNLVKAEQVAADAASGARNKLEGHLNAIKNQENAVIGKLVNVQNAGARFVSSKDQKANLHTEKDRFEASKEKLKVILDGIPDNTIIVESVNQHAVKAFKDAMETTRLAEKARIQANRIEERIAFYNRLGVIDQSDIIQFTQEFADMGTQAAQAANVAIQAAQLDKSGNPMTEAAKAMADAALQKVQGLVGNLVKAANDFIADAMENIEFKKNSANIAANANKPLEVINAAREVHKEAALIQSKSEQLRILYNAQFAVGLITHNELNDNLGYLDELNVHINLEVNATDDVKTRATAGNLRFYPDGSVVFVMPNARHQLVGYIEKIDEPYIPFPIKNQKHIDVKIYYLPNSEDFEVTQKNYIEISDESGKFGLGVETFELEGDQTNKIQPFLNEYDRLHNDELRVYANGDVAYFPKNQKESPRLVGHVTEMHYAGYDIPWKLIAADEVKTKNQLFSELFQSSANVPTLITQVESNGPKHYIYGMDQNGQLKLKELNDRACIEELNRLPFTPTIHVSDQTNPETFNEIKSKIHQTHLAGKNQKKIRLHIHVDGVNHTTWPNGKRRDSSVDFIKLDIKPDAANYTFSQSNALHFEGEPNKIIPFFNAYSIEKQVAKLEGLGVRSNFDELKVKILQRQKDVNKNLRHYYSKHYAELLNFPESFEQLTYEHYQLEKDLGELKAVVELDNNASLKSDDLCQIEKAQANKRLEILDQKYIARENRENAIAQRKSEIENKFQGQEGTLSFGSNGNVFFKDNRRSIQEEVIGSWMAEMINGQSVIKIKYGDQTELPNKETYRVNFSDIQFDNTIARGTQKNLRDNPDMARLIQARNQKVAAVRITRTMPKNEADMIKDLKDRKWKVLAEPDLPNRENYTIVNKEGHTYQYNINIDTTGQTTTETFYSNNSDAVFAAATSGPPINETNEIITFYHPMPNEAEKLARQFRAVPGNAGIPVRFTDSKEVFEGSAKKDNAAFVADGGEILQPETITFTRSRPLSPS